MSNIICPFCGKSGVRIKTTNLGAWEKKFYYPECICDGFDETVFTKPSDVEYYCTVVNQLKKLDPISREIIESNLKHLFEVHQNGDNFENERNKFYQLLSDIIHVEVNSTIVPWFEIYYALKH